ncbi:MAG TPA: TIGR02301 family protein [Hyphomicrobiaceae bacterium]|nr:TIGR02301 family protein [Hyphomicrobiaceae bacterium]
MTAAVRRERCRAQPGWWLLAVALLLSCPCAVSAQQPDTKPYDDKLMRLSEILGAVHYLRELCGNNDGQLWRDRMRELLDSEGGSSVRRAKLSRSFNDGYRSYSRTYQSCSQTAQLAIDRFLAEGAQLADTLVKTVP